MIIESPILFQIVIDLALLLAVGFLLWKINTTLKKPLVRDHQNLIQELKTVLNESQEASENFLRTLEQSRLALKELALELDLKEKRVKSLLAKPDDPSGKNGREKDVSIVQDKYQKVVDLIQKGYSEAETAKATGFTEAEIGLILDLYRVKNERT